MKKITTVAVGVLMAGMVLAGCSGDDGSTKNESKEQVEKSADESSEETEQTDDKVESEVEEEDTLKVYVPNEDATSLVEVEVDEDEFEDKSREEIVIDELKNTDTGNSDYMSAIRSDIDVNSVTVEGDMAVVDLSSENLYGSGVEESFLIDSVVMSLTELDGINSVQFLVDGEKRDSLMGHFEIGYPLTADDVGNNISEQ